MRGSSHRKQAWLVPACLVVAALAGLAAFLPTQATPPQEQKQEQEKKKPEEKKPEEKPKQGGLFGGVRAVTSMKKSEESELTASAGAKGVGEGKAIGKVPVSGADREKVARMASAMPSPAEMKTFLEEGRLSNERKGGRP
jgi:hypothetical protein